MKKFSEYSESGLEELFDSIGRENDAMEAEKAYSKVAFRLGLRKRSGWKMFRVAAMTLGAAACAAGLFFGGARFEASSGKDVLWNEITVPDGENRMLTLADGTRLLLKSSSRVTYPSEFYGKNRQVFLDGEVFAEVSKDKHKPFLITSGDVSVKVLGTRFDFRSYSSSESSEVALEEGSVEMVVKSGETAMTYSMKPGDVLQYDGRSGNVTRRRFSPQTIGQMNAAGSIHFVDQRLDDIVADLERIFDRKIVVADERLASRKFDAWFSNGEDLERILASINADGKMKIVTTNGVICIFSK